jgi:ribosomal protein S18 acetylase RimI-like enzyme
MASFEIKSADGFSLEALTGFYNQTRSDYLVPMPMTAADLAEYIQLYDISTPDSAVLLSEGEFAGLGMLGLRGAQSWITRLGMIPTERRQGGARALVEALIEAAGRKGAQTIHLEVIASNPPAIELFRSFNFRPRRELLVMKRKAGPGPHADGAVRRMSRHEIITHVGSRRDPPGWKTAARSYVNNPAVQGITLWLEGMGQGWLVYQQKKHALVRLAFETMGQHDVVIQALVAHVLHAFPTHEIEIENVSQYDVRRKALLALGFEERFRRIEMALELT